MRKKVRIKSIQTLLDEGWEPIVWGWIKNRADNQEQAHREISYYHGIEETLGLDRILTIVQDDPHGEPRYVHCQETYYKVAREVIC